MFLRCPWPSSAKDEAGSWDHPCERAALDVPSFPTVVGVVSPQAGGTAIVARSSASPLVDRPPSVCRAMVIFTAVSTRSRKISLLAAWVMHYPRRRRPRQPFRGGPVNRAGLD
jgi:hypothetical protein